MIREPTEQEITDRTEKMIDEVNDLSDALVKRGQKGETAFTVFAMRRLARLELLIAPLINSESR